MKENNNKPNELESLMAKNLLEHLKDEEDSYKPSKVYVAARTGINNANLGVRKKWNKTELAYKLKHSKNIYFSAVTGVFSKNISSLHISVAFGNPKAKPYFAFELYTKESIKKLSEETWKNDEFLQVSKDAVIIGDELTKDNILQACKLWYEQQVVDYLPKRNWEANINFRSLEI